MEAAGCQTRLVHGMAYNPLANSWCWIGDTSVNYALHAPEVLRQEVGVAARLEAVLAAEESEAGLVRAVVKCVAKLSRGAALPQVQTLLQAAPRLVALARAASRPDLRDNSLGTLINLSQVDQLRPGLGLAGVVELLVRSTLRRRT